MEDFLDDAPSLSVEASKDIRLYREPDNKTNYSGYSLKDFEKEVHDGVLFPSITTVLKTLNAPYLIQWAVNMSAKNAVEVGQKWPHRYTEAPTQAYNFLRNLHARDLKQAGDRGTRIHKILELIAQGKPVPMILTEEDKLCITVWEQFVKDFNLSFEYNELTGIGTTSNNLKYGGTTDFIATTGGIKVAGDYKCTTEDTMILMEDGSSKLAKDIEAGDRIVAWTAERNLHISTVAWKADNGVRPIVHIQTSHGQTLDVTAEHPFLVTRNKRIQWVPAAELEPLDTIYLATGWNHNPHRVSTPWEHKVSPYGVGVVWSIVNHAKKIRSNYILNPNISKQGLQELSLLGIEIVDEEGTDRKLVTKKSLVKALERNKKSSGTPFSEIFTAPQIPAEIFTTTATAQEGFLSGVREVFSNRGVKAEDYSAVLSTDAATVSLQQLYLNIGVLTERTMEGNKLANALTAPIIDSDELTTHGPIATTVVVKKKKPAKPTIAIEVEGSHTHVTNGIITHNTTRSGLHKTVALQLVAFKNSTHIVPDPTKPKLLTPTIQEGLAVHISPKKYEVKLADTSNTMWEIFEALRTAWYFFAFDGKTNPNSRTLSSPLKNVEALLNELKNRPEPQSI